MELAEVFMGALLLLKVFGDELGGGGVTKRPTETPVRAPRFKGIPLTSHYINNRGVRYNARIPD